RHPRTPLFQHRKALMTPQEKDLLTTLLARLKSAGGQPKDPEADTLIRQALAEQPDMPYYLTQTVLIQDLSLHQAQQRIADLEKQLADTQQAAKPTVGSFLGGLFGSRQPAAPAGPQTAGPWTRSPQVGAAPPAQPYGQPGYAQPGYGQPAGGGFMGGGMGGGGGFLRSAAATAAGVAGGALLFQGIESLFGPHYAGGLTGAGMTPGLGETVVNNYYGSDAAGGDWSSDPGGTSGGGDWSSDPAGSGGDWSSDPSGTSGGGDWSSDQGGGDWSSDGGGGDWSSGDGNISC
ncbi:MAG: DUF2076 domain-containing protein, partial [Alphaproteobacteria bacterium]|nr:DUF2076 domain-containing protein [Alphaproteobacteria bacterium]